MTLFGIARAWATIKSARSPKTAARRTRNIIVGRAAARAGIWRRLWK